MAKNVVIIQDRMRRALLAYETAERSFLNAHRRMKIHMKADVDAYWDGPGQQVKEDLRTAAGEVDLACKAASEAGLGLGTADRRLIARVQGYLAKPA